MRPSLFWHVMQHKMAVVYHHFETAYPSHPQDSSNSVFSDCLTPEDGANISSHNISKQLPTYILQHATRVKASTTPQC
jgi:hypothetical protein